MLVLPGLGRGDFETPTTFVAAPASPTATAAASAKQHSAPTPNNSLLLRQPVVQEAPTAEPTPTPLPTPTPEPWPTMEVRPGDTLLALASHFGLTPFEIASASGMSVDDYLQIGQTLSIPISAAAFSLPPDPNFVAVVTPAPAPQPAVVPVPQPTPPPTPAPAPYIPPSGNDVVAIICALPWPCDQMVRIASCESGLNPRAVNPAGYYGLFQIAGEFPGWDDAATNALVAYEQKYLPAERRGDALAPWPVCRYY